MISDGLGPFLLRSLGGTGTVRIAAMAVTFVSGVLLARILGVEEYGYYGTALAVITIAGIPAELGLPLLVTREVASAAAQHDDARIMGLLRWADRVCLKIAISVGAAVAAGGAAYYLLGSHRLADALLLGALVVPLIAMTRVRGAALQGLGHVVRGQIPWMLLRPSVFLVLLVVAYVLKFTLGAGAAMGLSALTAAIVLVITHNWMRDRLPPGHATQEISAQRDWLASSLRLGLMDGLRGLQSELSIILTGLVSGPQAVGFLRIATVTATTSAAAVLVVTYVALPLLARLRSEGDHEKLQKAVSALAWAQFAGVAALALPLMVIPGPLLSLAFGPAFVPAANALRIIAAAYLITAALGPNGPLLVVGNYEGSVARAMGAGLALNVITVPILAHFFGAAGTAIALGVSLVWWNLMCWWDAKRLLGVETSIIQWPWRASIPSTED